jgi:type II secretory pathway pseudopilin PulG
MPPPQCNIESAFMKGITPRIATSASAGFTLVELMVAGACLGLAITGVMAMLGAGQVLEMESTLLHQAKMYAAEELERDDLHYQAFGPADGVLTTKPVTLNNGRDVIAGLTVTVSSGNAIFTGYGGTGVTVPYRHIRVEVSWPRDNPTHSEILEKRIADIR